MALLATFFREEMMMTEENNNSTPPPEMTDIEVPETAFTACPLTEAFALVSVQKRCSVCEYFQGFYKADYRGRTVPFKKEYAVRCAHPVPREIIEVQI